MADLVNLNNSYEAMERALKRLGVFIVDDTEEIRRGMPGPLVALMRKLLFQTSVMVMKIMLLRGCPSHITDKKVVLAVCDLLREQMKYNPVISIEQFFTPGYVNHKLMAVAKLAEYIGVADRNAVSNSVTRSNFIVSPNNGTATGNNFNDTTMMSTQSPYTPSSSGKFSTSGFSAGPTAAAAGTMNPGVSFSNTPSVYTFSPTMPLSPTRLNAEGANSGLPVTPNTQVTPIVNRERRDRERSREREKENAMDEEKALNDSLVSRSAWPMTDFIRLHLGDKLHNRAMNSSTASSGGVMSGTMSSAQKERPKSPSTLRGRALTSGTPGSNSSIGGDNTVGSTPAPPAIAPPTPTSAANPPAPGTPRGGSAKEKENKEKPRSASTGRASSAPKKRWYEFRDSKQRQQEQQNQSNADPPLRSVSPNNTQRNNNGGGDSPSNALTTTSSTSASETPGPRVITMTEDELSKLIETKVDALVQTKVLEATKTALEKYDFLFSKLVNAVDAEFVLMNNRMRRLEAMLDPEDAAIAAAMANAASSQMSER